MRRRRIAYFTPLNPVRSGISDHSEDLIPHLVELMDVDVVIGPYRPTNEPALVRCNVIGAEQFLRQGAGYDLTLYQVGNNIDHHGYMIPCMAKFPGILALQDYCMQYLVLGLTLRRGLITTLENCLRPDYGSDAGRLSRSLLLHAIDPNEVSLAGPLIRMSKGVVVQSAHALALMRRDHPDRPVKCLPVGVNIPDVEPDVRALRARFDIGEADLVLLSMSTLSHAKRLEVILRALGELRESHPHIRLLIVGGGTFGKDARQLLERYRLHDVVRRTGWVDPDAYLAYTQLSDIVVDLRHTTGAETASSLLRGFAAGKPAIVSAQGTFLELPDAACLKVSTGGEHGAHAFAGAVRMLAADLERRTAMGRAARRYAKTELQLEVNARGYVEFIEELSNGAAASEISDALVREEQGALSRVCVSVAYKLFRLMHLYRTYGLLNVLDRIQREVASNGTS